MGSFKGKRMASVIVISEWYSTVPHLTTADTLYLRGGTLIQTVSPPPNMKVVRFNQQKVQIPQWQHNRGIVFFGGGGDFRALHGRKGYEGPHRMAETFLHDCFFSRIG